MTLWDELVGQDSAVAQMKEAAVRGSRSMTHSWLITGPPGSGRSTLALAFAAELVDAGQNEVAWNQIISKTHPDVSVLATTAVTITIEEVRSLVSFSHLSPSISRHRVIVIEDADRMTERTSNVLLKALEEPPPQTVWILCAPSATDLLATVRSRVRSVVLRVPPVEDVAALIAERESVELEVARVAATEAQSHIGMATRLATDQGARDRRHACMQTVLGVESVSAAVAAAARLLEIAKEDARALGDRSDSQEKEAMLASFGLARESSVPTGLRPQLKALEADQKKRKTRSLRDAIDRILVDLLSLFRDILIAQVGASSNPINISHHEAVKARAAKMSAQSTLRGTRAVREARQRIAQNSPPLLVLEALLIELCTGRNYKS